MTFIQVLNLRTESSDITAALATLSAFYGENSPAERRSLRTNVEKRNTSLNQEYLAAASPVIQVGLQKVECEQQRSSRLARREVTLFCQTHDKVSIPKKLQHAQLYNISMKEGHHDMQHIALSMFFPRVIHATLQVLDQIESDLSGLAEGCRLSKEAIGAAKDSTSTLLSETDRLHREAAANRKRTGLIQKFLQQYQLSPEEHAQLEVSPARRPHKSCSL